MNSSFDTIVARRRLRHFRHYLVWEPAAHQQRTSRFGERGISTPTYWGLLKQPDNQKLANLFGSAVVSASTLQTKHQLGSQSARLVSSFPAHDVIPRWHGEKEYDRFQHSRICPK
jgi:hypothetical protein